MKLLCVNARIIRTKTTNYSGDGLVEGEEYTTRGKPYMNAEGKPLYYIEGLGGRLCCRFTELLETPEEKFMSNLKEEFQLN